VPGLATKVATGGRLNVARSLEPPPEVTSLVPAGSVLGDVLVGATTTTDDEPIVQVDFFLDDDASPLATDIDGSDGWNTLWATTSVADGHHELTAVATDSVGDTGSRSVDVSPNNVDEAPSVSVSSPVAGAAVRGTVPVVASASDDEAVTKVEFFVGATSLGIDTVGSNGWSVSWNTLTLPEGNRSLTAVATDSIAQTTTSNAVVVRIDNVRTMHVHDLDTTSAIVSSSTWKAALTITVFDEAEKGVGRASVKVAWSGGRTGSVSCTTAANGLCTISLTKLSRSSVASITATVTGVTVRTGFTYDSSDNHNPDSDTSNGTSITINRP
jgi:hypothetical protein